MDKIKFSSISLSEELMRGIADIGFDDATSIQSQSIPLILEGHDVIGRSQTGSGKTAAFGLPAIDMIDMTINPKTVQVLIICPTRELAIQACNELKKFAKYKEGLNIVPIYGGESISLQLSRLRQAHQIVVGTPGRIMDHMRRRTLQLNKLKMVVLDEADEMLNMGFVEDIETILTGTPEERQTILFSATMPASVLAITEKFQKDPQIVEIKHNQMTVSTTEQFYCKVPKGQKTDALCHLLEYYKPNSSIIFCNTIKMVDELLVELKKIGYRAQGLHGDMRQSARTQVMHEFKTGQFDILVATDVAARGIDVNDIKIVINYDLPMEDEYYVHRIGRTGRAGKSGKAFSLIVGNKQLAQLRNIMRYTKCEIFEKAIPTTAEIKSRQLDDICENILTFMDEHNFKMYSFAVEKLISDKYTAIDIAAAMIYMKVNENVSIDDIAQGVAEADEDDSQSRNVNRGPKISKLGKKMREHNDENMVSVKISIGRRDRVSPNHILGAVAGESGLSGKLFGAITINDTYTTIDVPKELKTNIVKAVNNTKIMGKMVTAK